MAHKIKLMTHQVLGYPNFETNEKALEIFKKNNVEYVELQIPFSESSADGPTFVKANQLSIQNGTTVEACLEFIKKSIDKNPMKFLIMTYFNIIYQYGLDNFLRRASEIGIWGIIVPDAPVDEGIQLYDKCVSYQMNPIVIATPYTSEKRLQVLAKKGREFIYFVPRKGVTGSKTDFNDSVREKILQIKQRTLMECAVGFGIQEKADLEFLEGYADIAVIGSKITRIIEEEGIEKVNDFLEEIRE